jgi:tRNA-dihydrouridine synthase B
MSCEDHNATEPSPAIAPAVGGAPAASDLDPARVAEALVGRFGARGLDPRVTELVPGFDAPFYQAGLAGYSDAAMRIIARRHGCPFAVTEALLDRTLLAGGRGFAKADLGEIEGNLPEGDEDWPLAGQIMGSEPAEMAAASVKMIEQGARREKDYRAMAMAQGGAASSRLDIVPAIFDKPDYPSFAAIDINLACPVKKIAKKARGGHWLTEPGGAIAILEAVREAVPAHIPVTVKMRRAFDDSPAMAENFDRILNAAYDLGCAWVTVHARSVTQKYKGPSRWDLLRDIVAKNQGRLIFGSGDAWTAEEVFRMIGYTGVTGVSIARGCIGNPWIFRQCRDLLAGRTPAPPTLDEQKQVLLDHCALATSVNRLNTRGTSESRDARADSHTARTMRKFGIRFANHHPQAETVRKQFIACQTMDEWRTVLDCWYNSETIEAAI